MKKLAGETPVPASAERVMYSMSEGILTASITESGGISFQTTAYQLSTSASNTSRNGTTVSNTSTATFLYTPSFIILMPTSAYSSAGANSWTDSSDLSIKYLASGGSTSVVYGSGTNGTVSSSIVFTGNTVTLTVSAKSSNAYGVSGNCSVLVYGAI